MCGAMKSLDQWVKCFERIWACWDGWKWTRVMTRCTREIRKSKEDRWMMVIQKHCLRMCAAGLMHVYCKWRELSWMQKCVGINRQLYYFESGSECDCDPLHCIFCLSLSFFWYQYSTHGLEASTLSKVSKKYVTDDYFILTFKTGNKKHHSFIS